jgi:hypothetical protein
MGSRQRAASNDRKLVSGGLSLTQRDPLHPAPALGSGSIPGVVDQDPAHHRRGDGEEVLAVLPSDLILVDQPQVSLVHQGRGLERVVRLEQFVSEWGRALLREFRPDPHELCGHAQPSTCRRRTDRPLGSRQHPRLPLPRRERAGPRHGVHPDHGLPGPLQAVGRQFRQERPTERHPPWERLDRRGSPGSSNLMVAPSWAPGLELRAAPRYNELTWIPIRPRHGSPTF